MFMPNAHPACMDARTQSNRRNHEMGIGTKRTVVIILLLVAQLFLLSRLPGEQEMKQTARAAPAAVAKADPERKTAKEAAAKGAEDARCRRDEACLAC